MGSCTAQCKMLLFCVNIVVRESAKFELSPKEEELRKKPIWAVWQLSGAVLSRRFLRQWESSWPGKYLKMNSELSCCPILRFQKIFYVFAPSLALAT